MKYRIAEITETRFNGTEQTKYIIQCKKWYWLKWKEYKFPYYYYNIGRQTYFRYSDCSFPFHSKTKAFAIANFLRLDEKGIKCGVFENGLVQMYFYLPYYRISTASIYETYEKAKEKFDEKHQFEIKTRNKKYYSV